jgi:anti-sigma-K factor RskA
MHPFGVQTEPVSIDDLFLYLAAYQRAQREKHRRLWWKANGWRVAQIALLTIIASLLAVIAYRI